MSKIMEGISPLPWSCYGNTVGATDERQECCGIPDSNGECCGCPNVEWEEYQIASTGSDDDAAYIVHACNLYPELVEALERVANHKPLYEYVGIDGTQPGSPYDRGRQAEALLLAGIVAPILAKCKAGAE
jgi:hypothetical protein